MAVGFNVGLYYYLVGSPDFLHSFFSTVAYRLEGGKWGRRFPLLMKRLYYKELKPKEIDNAILELHEIKNEFRHYSPDDVIWDIEDLSKQPPWGKDISEDITDLSNYFVTSDGRDFIDVLFMALNEAKESNLPIKIEAL